MNSNSFETVVVNGQIQLPAGVVLPENAKIVVTISEVTHGLVGSPIGTVVSPRLADPSQAIDFTMQVVEPPDASL